MTTKHMEQLKEIIKKNMNSYKNVIVHNEIAFIKNNLTNLQKKIIYYSISLLKNEDRTLTSEELSKKEIIIELPSFLNLMSMDRKGGEIYNSIKREVEKIASSPLEMKIQFNKNQNKEQQKKLLKKIYSKNIKEDENFDFETFFQNFLETLEKNEEIEIEKKIFWIQEITYEKVKNEISRIKLNFTYSICEFLTNFETYVKYNFLISHSLKSKHSIRIYEMLQTRKDTNTIYIRTEDFIHAMGLSKTYETKSQLKKYVLEVAKKELNEKLGLGFDFSFGDKNSEYKNVLKLYAKKNNDDLTKELLTKEQLEVIEEQEQELKEQIKEQEQEDKEIFINEVYI